jgi:hypothetical protein
MLLRTAIGATSPFDSAASFPFEKHEVRQSSAFLFSADVGNASWPHGRSTVQLLYFRPHRINTVITEYFDALRHGHLTGGKGPSTVVWAVFS